ncbi:MAG: undecaprenyl-diphosphate phosphatase [Anaerolineales bacterium]
MNLIDAITLGIVQGLTEFIPVSSSGHLILARYIFGIRLEDGPAFIFDILVQMGTWVAVVAYYRNDLMDIVRQVFKKAERGANGIRLGLLIVFATLPAVIAGWLLRDSMEGFLSSLTVTGFFLVLNAAFLVIAELAGKRTRGQDELTIKDALWIGTFQIFALFPAISRSATTLSGGMTRNLKRPDAARFAFLMAVPVMPGAAVVALINLGRLPEASGLMLPLIVGFLAAAVVGFASIHWLLIFLSSRSLYPFAFYCTLVGAIVMLLARAG